MRKKSVSRKVVIVGAVLGLTLFAAWASASNMGFKLNFGVLKAINNLLDGSGVAVSAVVDDNKPPKTSLVVVLDLDHQELSPRNSNMGFKLNIASLPADGIEVETDEGVYLLTLDDEAIPGSGLSLEPIPMP
jgi:hypothetical protein